MMFDFDRYDMNYKIPSVLLFIWCINSVFAFENRNISRTLEEDKTLLRKRRYIVFPKGASLQLVYCNTYLFRPVVDIFRFGTTLGLAWQLPDDPQIYADYKKKHKIYKRNVLKKTETFLQHILNDGNGRECVLKALCESGQRTSSKKEFIFEILHKIFSVLVEENETDEETHDDKIYKKAHNSINQNCDSLYPNCKFSFFK